MTAPNIAGLTTVHGKTNGVTTSSSFADLVANPQNSNKVLKVNSITVANTLSTTASNVVVNLKKNGTGSCYIAYDITVPAQATLVVLSKETQLYLEENDKIEVKHSSGSFLSVICSYEEIS